MRVGIIALLHESNTFIAEPTTFDHFEQNTLLVGEEIRARLADTHHEIGGFFEGLERAGTPATQFDAVPLFAARALPYGTVTANTFEHLLDMMFSELKRAGRLDGLLVAPHGATVSEKYRDADGQWLSELRRRVGPNMPIIGTLDPHGNLSPKMVAACNALIAYRTNPHLDQRQRGIDAATLLARTLRGEDRPTMAAAFPPMAINIERQLTSEPQCVPLYRLADEMLSRPSVLSNSILLGFPYADVEEMGSAVIAVTNDDRTLAERLAGELANHMWTHRQEFVGQMIGIDEALDRAAQLDGPICLLDMGDNAGGGSPADSTFLAHSLHQRPVPDSFVCLYDPQSVKQSAAAGPGGRVRLHVGGKTDDRHGAPLEDDFTVVSLHEGKFEEPEVRHGGFTRCDQGQTAIVRTDGGLTVMLTSRRMPPFSLRQLTSCGLDPAAFHILVAKGVNAPVAAYAPVCKHLIRVNTPGVTTADMEQLDYHHRRRPMFPFEPTTEWP
jgi:microcystin degradation protein MlrC